MKMIADISLHSVQLESIAYNDLEKNEFCHVRR